MDRLVVVLFCGLLAGTRAHAELKQARIAPVPDYTVNFAANGIPDQQMMLSALQISYKDAYEELNGGPPINASSMLPAFSKPNEESMKTSLTGLRNSFALETTRNWLANGNTLTTDEKGHCIPLAGFCKPSKVCPAIEAHPNAKCSKTKAFRNEDGSCNDLGVPNLGMAGTTQQRLVANRYADGCDLARRYSLRETSKCSPLPSARAVSSTLSQSVRTADKTISLLLTTFGQFLDHDLTLTPMFMRKNYGKPALPLCCPFHTSRECLAIAVSDYDPFYSDYGVTCLNFARSVGTTTDPACGLGVRLQINQNSHWLDGSNIYGSGGKESTMLRKFDSGEMLISYPYDASRKRRSLKDTPDTFLPMQDDDACQENPHTTNAPCEDGQCCVMAGDPRAGEQPALSAMHTLWIRHHNRIADLISEQYADFDDEKVFQAARRIVTAQYQHIVFNEFLPLILGKRRMALYELSVLNGTHYLPAKQYHPGFGKVILEYSTAAGRFGHSLLHDNIYKQSSSGDVSSDPLSDNLNNIGLAISDSDDVGALLKGHCTHAALKMDQQITGEVQNKLFKKPSAPYGGDLFATNIQRGRDHGIGTYYDLRSYCLGDISVDPSWDSPVWDGVFNGDSLKTIKSLYISPMDVDLFAGGISEKPDPEYGGLLGPTFSCIIAKQFQHTKFGDRFWYEFENTVNGKSQFTGAQLAQIRKTSLARLMCDLTAVDTIQREVLKLSKESVECDDPDFMKETDVNYALLIKNLTEE
ncbi:peroxidase-like [Paramacrobiotus metropolitanus]|uniref:peroxidase-like n=1 Tax=Paramacrobiotus metropolitanus TaxID=2943436 RepID=UPI0024458980|nr:peroxidase-like [Paramacrobiotus metropolitanus]